MTDPLADMRRAHDGLPFSSVCMDYPGDAYFGPDWQFQMAQSHWFLATMKVAAPGSMSPIKTPSAAMLKHGADKLPLCIKDDNRPDPMQRKANRLPKTLESVPQSTVVMHLNDAGEVDDAALCDVFGPLDVWQREAAKRATDPYTKSIQAAIPEPAWIADNDNNEAYMLNHPYKAMGAAGAPVAIDRTRKWPTPTTALYKWRSPDEVKRVNLRLHDWILNNGGYSSDPDRFYAPFTMLHNAHYAAYDRAFVDASPSGWKNRYTEAYSALPDPNAFVPQKFVYDAIGPGLVETGAFDAVGPGAYLKPGKSLFDLTPLGDVSFYHTIWDYCREKNSRAYRSVWVNAGGDGALAGALAGVHEVVDPPLWKAWCAFIAWRFRASSGYAALNLRYWDNWATKRGELVFKDAAKLDALGRPDLKTATVEDYVQAMAAGIDEINMRAQPFWEKGVTIPVPTSGTKAPFVAVRLGEEVMVYCFTPCKLGVVTLYVPGVGDVSVDMTGRFAAYRFGRRGLVWGDL